MYQRPRMTLGPGLTPMIRALLVALVGCYVLEMLAVHWLGRGRWVQEVFALTPSAVLERGYVWQLFTYQWLHDWESLWHILLNGFGLYLFGALLERRWGGWTFLRFYLITGFASGLVILVSGWFFYPYVPTIGCSGAVLGLAAAFGIVYAEMPVFLFGILPMRARSLLLLILAMVLLDWLMRRPGISVAGHLGGLAAGFLLVTGWWRPAKLLRALRDRAAGRERIRFERKDESGRPPWVN